MSINRRVRAAQGRLARSKPTNDMIADPKKNCMIVCFTHQAVLFCTSLQNKITLYILYHVVAFIVANSLWFQVGSDGVLRIGSSGGSKKEFKIYQARIF
jgi:hypothetical protein